MNTLDMLRRLTDAGLYCFLLPKGKKADNIKWQDIASNKYDEVVKRYSENNNTIAVLTGSINNLLLIDLDVQKDSNHDIVYKNGSPVKLGLHSLLDYFGMKFTDDEFKTYIEKTQSGGLHILYKIPKGKPSFSGKANVNGLAGVDTRGEGNYFIIAPSVGEHGNYEIINDVDFNDIPEMPMEFYDFFSGERTQEDDTDWKDLGNYRFNTDYTDTLVDTIADIFRHSSGIGNYMTRAIGGTMATHGIPEQMAMEILQKAAAKDNYRKNDWKPVISNTYKRHRDKTKIYGMPTLLKLLSDNKDKFEDYDKIVDSIHEIFRYTSEYTVVIDDGNEYGIIRDSHGNNTGSIVYRKITHGEDKDGNPTESISNMEVMRYMGSITKVIKFDDGKLGLHIELDQQDPMDLNIDDAITNISKHYAISPTQKQKMVLILRKYVWDNRDNATPVSLSDVVLDNDIVRIMHDNGISVKDVLLKLRGYLEYASNVNGYLAVMSWTLSAPMHYWMKKYADTIIYVPNIVLSGRTHGGKTSLADLFIHRGFDISDMENFIYHVGDIRTSFALMDSLKASNLPAIFDEMDMPFFKSHAEEIKGYASSTRFKQLGTSSQNINKYVGKRSFIATTNIDFDTSVDLAASNRIIAIQYTDENSNRRDMDKYMEFKNSLPHGFMYAIMKDAFDGMNIKDITKRFEDYQDPVEWLDEGLKIINSLCSKYGVPEFPSYKKVKSTMDTIVYQIAQAMVSEYERMENDMYKRSPLYGDILVEEDGKRQYIYFTSGAYKQINRIFNYDPSPVNYMNNIPSDDMIRVERGGNSFPKKINKYVKRVYCVSIFNYNGEDTGSNGNADNGNSDNGNSNNNGVLDYDKAEQGNNDKKEDGKSGNAIDYKGAITKLNYMLSSDSFSPKEISNVYRNMTDNGYMDDGQYNKFIKDLLSEGKIIQDGKIYKKVKKYIKSKKELNIEYEDYFKYKDYNYYAIDLIHADMNDKNWASSVMNGVYNITEKEFTLMKSTIEDNNKYVRIIALKDIPPIAQADRNYYIYEGDHADVPEVLANILLKRNMVQLANNKGG